MQRFRRNCPIMTTPTAATPTATPTAPSRMSTTKTSDRSDERRWTNRAATGLGTTEPPRTQKIRCRRSRLRAPTSQAIAASVRSHRASGAVGPCRAPEEDRAAEMQETIHRFARFLRLAGIRISVAEVLDAAAAAAQPGIIGDRATLREALLVTLVKDRRDRQSFDAVSVSYTHLRAHET